MWSEYAHDPRMKANIGIRRRLAPLLDNDVNRMELFTALLLSLPGSPVLYYGDEIGMGDNIWLGDRDGVRTPMQWTPDRNAGFSAATPGKLHLPAIQDPVYGYQSVNVEAQLENTSSLLHWTRRLVHARRRHPAFGLGDFVDLGGSNPSVLSYIREHRGAEDRDVILCVNNLSRFPQPVELDLRQWEGMVPDRAARRRAVPGRRRAALPAHPGWLRLPLAEADRTDDRGGGGIVNDDLTSWISEARWFGGKGRDWTLTSVRRVGELPDAPEGLRVAIQLAEVTYDDGSTDLYQLPLAFYAEPQERISHALIGEWDDDELGHALRLRRAARPPVDGPVAGGVRPARRRAGAAVRRARRPHVPPAAGPRPRHRGPLDALLRRAVQLVGRVRRGRADEGLPQGDPGRQPRHRDPPGPHRGRARPTSPRSTAGSTSSTTTPTPTIQLAMLQQFLRTASDGWDLALASVRNLFAEADLHADEVGGDFAGEAARLGIALAEVHADLAAALPGRAARGRRPGRAGRGDGGPARRRPRRRTRPGRPRGRAARDVRPAARARRRSRCSRSTATCTSARPCAPSRAGRSSTSRASRPSRSPSG